VKLRTTDDTMTKRKRTMIYKTLHTNLLIEQTGAPLKLKAQWAEPVSLTIHSVLSKLYTEPTIVASYQVSVHLAKRFQRRRFFY